MKKTSVLRAIISAFTQTNNLNTKAEAIIVNDAGSNLSKSPTKAKPPTKTKFKQNQRKQRKASARKKARKN